MKRIILIFCIAFMCVFRIECFAKDIPDITEAVLVEDNGLIFDTSVSTYSENGNWSDNGVGFMERIKRTATTKDSAASWDGVKPGDNGYYKIYIWKNVIDDGDTQAFVEWFATGSSYGNKYIDFSFGESNWEYIGVCNTSDLTFDIKVTASGNGVLPVCCFKLVKTNKNAFLEYLQGRKDTNIIFKINADKALVNDNTVPLDMGKAIIVNSTTMIPLRFVTENMGAEVFWDETDRTVKISEGDNSVLFKVGSDIYTVNGEERKLLAVPFIENERTMIPARALSEALGKNVYWVESGVVIISNERIEDLTPFTEKGLKL